MNDELVEMEQEDAVLNIFVPEEQVEYYEAHSNWRRVKLKTEDDNGS